MTDLADVSVAVADPDVLEPVRVESDGGRGARELQAGARLPDRDQVHKVGRSLSILGTNCDGIRDEFNKGTS